MIDLDGLTMFVSRTADHGVVGGSTRLHFTQCGSRVCARYSGGSVTRGWLVGRYTGDMLTFCYVQHEGGNSIHGGNSVCEVQRLETGRTRIIEHFTWRTRAGSGINVFDEVEAAR
jgi:hypothetical protein